MQDYKYPKATLIIDNAYASSLVSAHSTGKVSTSAPYNYNSFINLIADKLSIDMFSQISLCDALPYYDPLNEASMIRTERVKKFHEYLRRNHVKVKIGRTEKVGDTYRQTGVNSAIVDSIWFYHQKHRSDVPIVIVSADRTIYDTIKRLTEDGREIILVGSHDEEKKLFYKPSLKGLVTNFLNLTTEDILAFKDRPDFKKD